jgi:all-trans-retinol dehydrogenase (NAD+)
MLLLIVEVALGVILLLFLIDAFWRSKKDVSGKTVLITGAGSGLGRLLSLKFAQERCVMVLWDMNLQGVEETARMCKEKGALAAIAMKVDLSDRNDVRGVAERVKLEVGDVDILVNNAGIVSGKKMMECSEEMIIKTMEVNTLALFWTTRAFLPAMLAKNSGHLVTMASLAGLVGVNGLADYSASKFGAFGFNESMRFELAAQKKYGVKTTVVCPFFINTGMFDGVRAWSPNLMPILDPNYAVDMIFNAIVTNVEYLVMPRFPYLITLARSMFPVYAFDWTMNFLGVNRSMDDFKGRTAAKEAKNK